MNQTFDSLNAVDTVARVGAIRVCDAVKYGYPSGFIVEMCGWHGSSNGPTWAVPAWDEMGLGSIAGVFTTFHSARRALMASAA